jgi:hypothetical protein
MATHTAKSCSQSLSSTTTTTTTTRAPSMSSSRSSSTTAGRKAALVKFKEARRKRDLGEDDDRFGNIKEEEDVYDIVEETEYQSLVESRRQREDFVVDDGTQHTVSFIVS